MNIKKFKKNENVNITVYQVKYLKTNSLWAFWAQLVGVNSLFWAHKQSILFNKKYHALLFVSS